MAASPTRARARPQMLLNVLLNLAGLYENEIHFYDRLAKLLPAGSIPRLHAVERNGPQFVLAMEDLGANGTATFRNIVEKMPRSEVEAVLRNQAALHAQFWNRGHEVWSETLRQGDALHLTAYADDGARTRRADRLTSG
jgi:hypothetical protein